MNVIFKNTFLEVVGDYDADCGAAEHGGRAHSAPPPIGAHAGRRGRAGLAAQLARLDAIVGSEALLSQAGADEEAIAAHKPESNDAGTTGATESPVWQTIDEDIPGFGELALKSGLDEAAPLIVLEQPEHWDAEELRSVPLDDDGEMTSVGSKEHGQSCRPCAFLRSTQGCKFGVWCKFCHFATGHPETVRVRPCKGKRERLKKSLAVLEESVAQDPALFYDGELKLPAFVDNNPRAHARVMARLAAVAKTAISQDEA